jgi:hypothetical protein
MTNVILTENGAINAPGAPDYYLGDDDFVRVFNDEDFAKQLYEYFGTRVCLGRLGVKDSTTDAYVERVFEQQDVVPEQEGLCYYEKVK